MSMRSLGWPRAVLTAIFLSTMLPSLTYGQSVKLRDMVIHEAQQAAREPFLAPASRTDASKIDYTRYLGIRVMPGREIWANEKLGFALHPMPLGALHTTAIKLATVDQDGTITPVSSAPGLYEHSLAPDQLPPDGDLGISGFRITAHLNDAAAMDELIVFQGASYFRALSTGQAYGLSARGLSLDTGQSTPEEFPEFRQFWIEKPGSSSQIVIHALLDSPAVTGAYMFVVRPGAPTAIDVTMSLFPRRDLHNVGIAPLTSMYFYSVGDNASPARDYRPAVHDSDGLLMMNGKGERLWRPLRNPPTLRASSFADSAPKGFGLMQRQRDFAQYQDLEARYHRRPSAWVEPLGDWGPGSVELFELPTDSEYHDNIVAQWKPAEPLRAGGRYDFTYRLSWPDRAGADDLAATVDWTRSGPAGLPSAIGETERFVVDYTAADFGVDTLPQANVTASAGTVSGVTTQLNPVTGGLRVSFLFDPGNAETADLRVDIATPAKVAAEIWLYQWTNRRRPGSAL